jgi:hypothetical protein
MLNLVVWINFDFFVLENCNYKLSLRLFFVLNNFSCELNLGFFWRYENCNSI